MGNTFEHTDHLGDTLSVSGCGNGGVLVRTRRLVGAETVSVALNDREDTLRLYEALGDHLAATQLDAEDPGDACVADCEAEGDHRATGCAVPPTILEEANALVYGDRQGDYGHPREDFTRTAILWTGVLNHKLADGEFITPEDIALCMVQVKVSREVNKPKRDNRVDGAGYFLCLDRLETGR